MSLARIPSRTHPLKEFQRPPKRALARERGHRRRISALTAAREAFALAPVALQSLQPTNRRLRFAPK
jgi:hypothetical protein